MSGGMAFRKDCEACGRSFLTPDKKAKICQRCAGKGQPRPQTETVLPKGLSPKAAGNTKKSIEKSPPSGTAHSPRPPVLKEKETKEDEHEVTEHKGQQAPKEEEEVGQKRESPIPDRKKEEIELTQAQIQEIADRYQKYVRDLERPSNGRRKTIAADMGIPSRSVVLALRQWNQQQVQIEDLTREERFTIEKAYFSRLEGKNPFLEIQDQIVQETGLNPWVVSRYLDLLHDGEEKLSNVSNVSSEQEKAILNEYQKYLSASGPPSSALHPLIAERTGVSPKQVYRVLLSYRLSRFREKWG
jgi:hypothetical protein